jgi:hypothetical protein
MAILQAVQWAVENEFDESLLAKCNGRDSKSNYSSFQDVNQVVAESNNQESQPHSPSNRSESQRLTSLYDDSSKITSFRKSPSISLHEKFLNESGSFSIYDGVP